MEVYRQCVAQLPVGGWTEHFDTEEKAMLWLFSDWGNDECASNVLIEFLNPKDFRLQKHIGFAGDAREYEMRASIRGEPVLISTATGRSITVTWERLVALAETIGLRCNMDSVEKPDEQLLIESKK